MEYEEIKLLKQSEKSTVHLVRTAGGGEQVYVRKRLDGQHPVYQMLRDCPHPCLPRLYEVTVGEDTTTVIEEYIDGSTPDGAQMSGKQLRGMIRQLCGVLEFLHGKGIIHRDIKPSNLLLTEDGQLYLIDFDAARTLKEKQEQDTRLLGTRGFAPPEQYGFAQTDERTDIYALGATLERILGGKAGSSAKKVIRRCMNLDPDKRYQSVREVRQAFFHTGLKASCAAGAVLLLALVGIGMLTFPLWQQSGEPGGDTQSGELTVLPAPGNPHWDGETGTAVWGNVPEAGIASELQFMLRLYKADTQEPPAPDEAGWIFEDKIRMGDTGLRDKESIEWSLATELNGNGIYYFTISAVGDGAQYADSPYSVSDAFIYTGEDAPPLPTPTGLRWEMYEVDNTTHYLATWDNLDVYEDKDSFNVTVYDQNGAYVMNNIWYKRAMEERWRGGMPIQAEYLKLDNRYRFTVEAYSSRPNEYGPSLLPDPAPEEYYSPWLFDEPQRDE